MLFARSMKWKYLYLSEIFYHLKFACFYWFYDRRLLLFLHSLFVFVLFFLLVFVLLLLILLVGVFIFLLLVDLLLFLISVVKYLVDFSCIKHELGNHFVIGYIFGKEVVVENVNVFKDGLFLIKQIGHIIPAIKGSLKVFLTLINMPINPMHNKKYTSWYIFPQLYSWTSSFPTAQS